MENLLGRPKKGYVPHFSSGPSVAFTIEMQFSVWHLEIARYLCHVFADDILHAGADKPARISERQTAGDTHELLKLIRMGGI